MMCFIHNLSYIIWNIISYSSRINHCGGTRGSIQFYVIFWTLYIHTYVHNSIMITSSNNPQYHSRLLVNWILEPRLLIELFEKLPDYLYKTKFETIGGDQETRDNTNMFLKFRVKHKHFSTHGFMIQAGKSRSITNIKFEYGCYAWRTCRKLGGRK